MPFIETIPYDQASGELKSIYDDLIKKRGKLAAVHTIQSLNPKTIVAHMDLYMITVFGKSPIRRYQREMMAVIVSTCNNCSYCIDHHAAALLHFWKDEGRVKQLSRNYGQLNLPDQDLALCKFAERLTLSPSAITTDGSMHQLRSNGFDDRAILDASLVISYFNFVNRIVLGLGVETETDVGGFYYE